MSTEPGAIPRRDLQAPVRRNSNRPPTRGIGLCLSGGGFRAMLFHAGSLWRLNDAGWLPLLHRVSSVSGGSIAAGLLGARWHALRFEPLASGESGDLGAPAQATNFEREFIDRIRGLADHTIDVPTVLLGLLIPGASINGRLVETYRRLAFGNLTLQDLPDKPDFVINATSLQTGNLWLFSKSLLGDPRVGHAPSPRTQIAVAVAASSAFPPILSPAILDVSEGAVAGGSDPEVARVPYTARAVLSDGGVYDNLGLEMVWPHYDTVLVSDGGAHIQNQANPNRSWVTQFWRMLHVIDNQVLDLRKRQAISSFQDGLRHGTFWGIRSHVRDYGLADPMLDPTDETIRRLAGISTRLAKLDPVLQERLINWGYLMCDTALRRWVDQALPAGTFPYPSVALG